MGGIVVIVFFLFQGFGDPARLVMGQTGDAATLENIRKDLGLDKPLGVQLLLYVNDISPVCMHPAAEIDRKGLKGIFWVKRQGSVSKFRICENHIKVKGM